MTEVAHSYSDIKHKKRRRRKTATRKSPHPMASMRLNFGKVKMSREEAMTYLDELIVMRLEYTKWTGRSCHQIGCFQTNGWTFQATIDKDTRFAGVSMTTNLISYTTSLREVYSNFLKANVL